MHLLGFVVWKNKSACCVLDANNCHAINNTTNVTHIFEQNGIVLMQCKFIFLIQVVYISELHLVSATVRHGSG